MVIGYSRAWLRRPEVGIRVKRSLFESLDPEGQSLLRFEPVVSDDDVGEWVRPSCLLVCALPVSIYLYYFSQFWDSVTAVSATYTAATNQS